MLIEMKRGGTKKYVKLEEAIFSDFNSADILAESSKNVAAGPNLTECVTLTPYDFAVVQQDSEWPSSQSLTDTLSVSTSSSLSSDKSDTGCEKIQPVMDSTHARNAVEQILTSKSAGVTVLKEYEETGSLKDSTRGLMVNIIVAVKRKGTFL
ncbi:hypothetical protein SRHO_G00289690 [Serrasalmus rhombeus]